MMKCGRLSAVCVCLALVGLASPAGAGESSKAPISGNPLASLDKGGLKDFVEKPLFDPSRSVPVVMPFVATAPPVYTVPPEPPPSLHLLGVIEGENAMAIARGPDMKTLMLHSGDRIGAWSVLVMPNGIRLSNGDRTSDYGLFTSGSGKGVTPGPMPSLEPAAGVSPGLGLNIPSRSMPAHHVNLQK